jgi:hypothetical protein
MISRFSQFLVEEEQVCYFVFGRMNPPTIGHGRLLDVLAKQAGRNNYRIYLSQSQNNKKDPLSYSDKVKFCRKMFPRYARSIIIDNKVKTPFDALTAIYNSGCKKVVMVAGSDRVDEYKTRLNLYNGKKGKHGFYNFEGGIKVVSAGARDPDAEGVEGMSASKMRKYATDGDFTKFAQGLGKSISTADARKLMNAVRSGLGLRETTSFQNHIQLSPVSERREQFVSGTLFELGEMVVIKDTDEVGKITLIGSNYLIVESGQKKLRKWIHDVEHLEEDNTKSMYADKPDWGTDASAQKAKRMTPNEANTTHNNYGIPKGASLSDLDKIYNTTTNKQKKERAHWLRNMRRGANKK